MSQPFKERICTGRVSLFHLFHTGGFREKVSALWPCFSYSGDASVRGEGMFFGGKKVFASLNI